MVNTRKTSTLKQTEYERQRQTNIERNAMKFQALGLSKLANQLLTKVKGHQGKEKRNHAHDDRDEEYMPEENGDEHLLNEEDEHHVADHIVLNSTSNYLSKKVLFLTFLFIHIY